MAIEDVVIEDEDLDQPDIVEWYETRPVTVSTPVAAAAVLSAFALGAVAALAAVALVDHLRD